jgi:hypothetical protein
MPRLTHVLGSERHEVLAAPNFDVVIIPLAAGTGTGLLAHPAFLKVGSYPRPLGDLIGEGPGRKEPSSQVR